VHKKQTTTLIGIDLIRQTALPGIARETIAFILDLPNQPIRRENPADSQALARVTRIAMTHGIDQGFLKTKLQPT